MLLPRRLASNVGFTLIELLIVVAIIAILAAIAVPNFLEAQMRSKVSRVRADHNTLATALEAYRIDQNAYPSANSQGSMKWVRWISTPIAYITHVDMPDPFAVWDLGRGIDHLQTYRYYGFNDVGYTNADTDSGEFKSPYSESGTPKVLAWVMFSHGPDHKLSKSSADTTFIQEANLKKADHMLELIYDPTNGTVSNGEILRAGGAPTGTPEAALRLIVATQGR